MCFSLLMSRMKNTASLKLHSILLNPCYNNQDAILYNLVFACRLQAVKFKALARLVSRYTDIPLDYLYECIETAVFFIANSTVKVSKGIYSTGFLHIEVCFTH